MRDIEKDLMEIECTKKNKRRKVMRLLRLCCKDAINWCQN